MEPLSRSSISARGVSVRCTGHRLRMVHTANTINTSLAHSTGPPAASSAILRRKLLNSFRIKKRSAVRPRQYCDRRRRGNTGCRTFPAGHPVPSTLSLARKPKDTCRTCLSADTERWTLERLWAVYCTRELPVRTPFRGRHLPSVSSGPIRDVGVPLLAAGGTQCWARRRERATSAREERSYAFTEARGGGQRCSTSRCGCRQAGLRTAAW